MLGRIYRTASWDSEQFQCERWSSHTVSCDSVNETVKDATKASARHNAPAKITYCLIKIIISRKSSAPTATAATAINVLPWIQLLPSNYNGQLSAVRYIHCNRFIYRSLAFLYQLTVIVVVVDITITVITYLVSYHHYHLCVVNVSATTSMLQLLQHCDLALHQSSPGIHVQFSTDAEVTSSRRLTTCVDVGSDDV